MYDSQTRIESMADEIPLAICAWVDPTPEGLVVRFSCGQTGIWCAGDMELAESYRESHEFLVHGKEPRDDGRPDRSLHAA